MSNPARLKIVIRFPWTTQPVQELKDAMDDIILRELPAGTEWYYEDKK